MNIITSLMASMFSATFPKKATLSSKVSFGIELSDDDHRVLVDKLHELNHEEIVEDEGGTFTVDDENGERSRYTYTYSDDGVEWIQD